jgi:hypothetical protein
MTSGVTPALARSLLHTVHLLTAAVLFGTGLLLLLPALRAQVTGGHSLLIRDAHRWGGVAFAALPLLIVAAVGVRTVFGAPAVRTLRSLWQGVHLGITVAMGAIFTLTGVAIWEARRLPEALADTARVAHDWLTWALALLVAAHLLEVGIAVLWARLRSAAATDGPAAEP